VSGCAQATVQVAPLTLIAVLEKHVVSTQRHAVETAVLKTAKIVMGEKMEKMGVRMPVSL